MFRAFTFTPYLHFLLHHGLMILFAAGGAALPAASGGGEGGGGGGASSTGSGGSGGSPSPSGAQPGSPSGTGGAGTSGNQGSPGQGNGTLDWSTAPAHFRTAYEQLKAQHEPWQGLGVDHSVAGSYVNVMKGMISESYTLGRQLGYKDNEIQEALRTDLLATINHLRGAATKANPNGGGNGGGGNGAARGNGIPPEVQRLIDSRVAPFEQHLNSQMVDTANQAFVGEYDRLFADHYKADAANIPPDVKDLLRDAVSEVFKYDDAGLKSLKFQRDVRPIAKTFAQVLPRFEKAFNAYHMWQLKRAGQGGGGNPNAGSGQQGGQQGGDNPWAGISLDDIASGEEKAVKLIPSMR